MAKTKPRKNNDRQKRIAMEIVVDANGPEEQAMGWYYYLEEKLQFPFTAECKVKRAISPLQLQDEVDVIGMAPDEECEKEMSVTVRWERDGLAVPLSQLTPINSTETQTKEEVEDWHYWVQMGYQFMSYRCFHPANLQVDRACGNFNLFPYISGRGTDVKCSTITNRLIHRLAAQGAAG